MTKPKPKKPTKKRKPRRVVLGVGHPWFVGTPCRGLIMYKHPVGKWEYATLKHQDLGNWNRIRLVAEVIE